MFSSCCRADDKNLLILQIVYDPLYLPEDLNPDLADLLKGLLCKDPMQRFSLEVVANHPWVVMGYGPVDE
jgi:serine/threonine protein kinase